MCTAAVLQKESNLLKHSFASGRLEGTSGGKKKDGTEQSDKCLGYRDRRFFNAQFNSHISKNHDTKKRDPRKHMTAWLQ